MADVSAGDAIAIYAALVATGSLAWQIVAARRARQSGVTVALANAIMIPSREHTISVTAFGRGQRPVGITGAAIDPQDGSGMTIVLPDGHVADTIPGTVAPHHSLVAHFPVASLREYGVDLTKPIVGLVNLATGETVRSKPKTLMGD